MKIVRSGFAVLMLVPFAALAAPQTDHDTMQSDDAFYISASYGLALPVERTFYVPDPNQPSLQTDVDAGTDWGFLGGQLGVGYALGGFRPELAVGYRTSSISSITLTKLNGATSDSVLKSVNAFLEDVDWEDSFISSLDLVAAVYYDIDTGTPITPFVSVGGGASNITVTVKENTTIDKYELSGSAWSLAFQAAAGVGYSILEELVVSFGYRLTGTTEATFKSDNRLAGALGHHLELGIRYGF